jgi:hypothetical protein
VGGGCVRMRLMKNYGALSPALAGVLSWPLPIFSRWTRLSYVEVVAEEHSLDGYRSALEATSGARWFAKVEPHGRLACRSVGAERRPEQAALRQNGETRRASGRSNGQRSTLHLSGRAGI